jgi:hypothetical protein
MLLAANRSFRPGEEGTVKLGVYDSSVVGLRKIREDCLLHTAYISGPRYVDECDWKLGLALLRDSDRTAQKCGSICICMPSQ